MTNRPYSRRDFLGTSALGALAAAAALANPVRAAADSVGVKPADLPDLTIKEVKVYVANLGPTMRRINSPESGEIVSLVTASGIEGNYTLGNRVPGTGWLEYAKGVCLGKSVLDLLPALVASANERNHPTTARSAATPASLAVSATPTASTRAASRRRTITPPSSMFASGTSWARR